MPSEPIARKASIASMKRGPTWHEHQIHQRSLVKRASLEIIIIADAWHRIKTLPEWNGRLDSTNNRHKVLAALAARQARLLVGVNACACEGCDQAALILCRSMYESYLCSLALAYGKDDQVTANLAEKLIDHNSHLISYSLRSVDSHEALQSLGVSEDEIVKALENQKSSRASTKKDPNWHEFKNKDGRTNLDALREYLWPVGIEPIFPSETHQIDRIEWDSMWEIFWSYGSDVVHTSGMSVMEYARGTNGGMVDDSPLYVVDWTVQAALMFWRSVVGLAAQADMVREFEMETYLPIQNILQISKESRPYLVTHDPDRSTIQQGFN